MIVCVCRRVSDHDIRRAADEGAMTLECLQFELGVAMQCGRCAESAEQVLCGSRCQTRAANHSHAAASSAAACAA